ncbi:MAG TPA: PAS domain S-box protein [Terriglobales bacterium]|nr:PAS domain S-box protein [Terriglobales bacterium]
MREAESTYCRLFERSLAALFRTTVDGRPLDCNDAFARMYGYDSREEVLRTPCENLYADPADRQDYVARLQREGAVHNHELWCRRKDGTALCVLSSAVLVRGTNGEPDVIEGMDIDITGRKRAEEHLRIRTAALEAAANAVLITGRDGTIIWANPAFSKLTGYSVEEAIGRNPQFLKSGLHGTDFYRELWQTILSGRTWEGEMQNRRKDGSLYVEEMTITPVADHGEVTHFIAIKQDVTARKQAEEALRRSEERYRLVTRATNNAVWDWNIWTNETVWNDALQSLFGHPPPSPDGDGHAWWLERVHEDDRAHVAATLHTALRGSGSVVAMEYRFQRADGTFALVADRGYIMRNHEGDALRMIGAMADITELRGVEMALRQSEDKFSRAFHSSPTPMIISTLQGGRYLDVNEAFLRMIGQTRSEVIGRTAFDIGFWWDAEQRSNVTEILRQRGRLVGRALQFRHKNGAQRSGQLSAELIQVAGQDCMLSVVTDETERVAAEEALRRSEERFRQLFESHLIGLHIARFDGRVVMANDAWLKMTGYTRSDLAAGRANWKAMTPSEHVDSDVKAGQQLQASGTATPREKEYFRKDGSRFPVLIGLSKLEGSKDEAVAFILDISERKRAEEERERLHSAIEHSAAEWRETFDAMQSPIVLLDAAGRILRINGAGQRLAGLGYERLLGLAMRGLPGEPWQAAANLATRLTNANQVAPLAIRDETGRSWDIEALPMAGADAGNRTIVILRDTTELVKLQESLLRTETLSTLGSLVAGVAHEVRNPLFGISSTLDAFEARFGSQPSYERYVGALRRETSRMTELMKQLLELGKPSSPDRIQMDLGVVLGQALHTCAPMATQAGVKVLVHAHAPATVLAERLRLIQVFQNLVENAVQHSSPGQLVDLELETMEESGRRWVECCVLDCGSGIATQDLDRIFEPFFSRRAGGTGLGLSIVQRIVEEHGGTISIRNRPQGGTEARVRLPLVSAPVVQPADEQAYSVP